MGSLASLIVRIGADIRGFSSAMQNVNRELAAMGKQMQAVGTTLSLTLTAPIAAIGTASLMAAADMEALMKGLTAVSGSAEEANKEFEALKEVAKLPGLGLEEAVKGSINLQAIGVKAEDARKAMLAMGNAIATVGGGKANFDLAIRGFSQLVNAAKPLQQDLYQIANQVPQINAILKNTFGSNRAEDLAALGLTGKQVADTLVYELGKLPPVAGGLKNAFENVKDSISVSLASVGDVINKTFNIEGLINKIGDVIGGLVERFKNLSPEVQKAILMIAGIAAAIGPVLVVLGAVASAIAAISLPVIGIVAAVGAAVGLIISYWDEIAKYFNSGAGSQIWETVKEAAYILYEILKEIFSSIVDTISFLWNTVGQVLVGVISKVWPIVKSVFLNSLDAILNIIKFFKGVFTGNWQLVWDSVLNIGKIAINGIISLAKSMVDTFLDSIGVITGLLEKAGIGDTLVQSFKDARKSLDTWTSGLKMSTSTSDKAKKSVDELAASWSGLKSEQSKSSTNSTSIAPTFNLSKSVSDKELKKQHDAEIKAVQEKYAIEQGLLEQALIQKQISEKEFSEKSKQIRISEIDSLMKLEKQGTSEFIKLQNEKLKLQQGATISTADIEEAYNKEQALLEQALIRKEITQSEFDKRTRDNMIREIDALLAIEEAGSLKYIQLTNEKLKLQEQQNNQLSAFQQRVADFAQSVKSTMEQASEAMIANIASMVGSAIAGGEGLKELPKMILGTLGNLMGQIGKAAIGIGLAMKGIKLSFANPAGAIAAGIALVAASGVLATVVSKMNSGGSGGGGNVPAFANGGMVFGPTLGLMGEYAGASRNPEVIAPLNQLQGMLNNGSANNGYVEFYIYGSDLKGVLKRQDEKERRGA